MNLVTYTGTRHELQVKMAGGRTYTFRPGKTIPVPDEHVHAFETPDFDISASGDILTPSEMLETHVEEEEYDEDEWIL